MTQIENNEPRASASGSAPLVNTAPSRSRLVRPNHLDYLRDLKTALRGPRLRARATRAVRQFNQSRRPLGCARAKGSIPENALGAPAMVTRVIRSATCIVPISAHELKGDRGNSAAQTRPPRRAQSGRRPVSAFRFPKNTSPHPPP